MADAARLIVQDLRQRYRAGDAVVDVLQGVSLSMSHGDAVAVTGPSGSGKSTLLYILGALEAPAGGSVELGGVDPWKLSSNEQAAFRNRSIGFIFQDHHLLPQCSVLDNVLMPTLAGIPSDSAAIRARDLLDRVGLSHRLNHFPAQLSGGERQRVAVCRALINRPTLLLADEPTGNLDAANAMAVGRLLLDLNAEFRTLLICVTHSEELAAMFPVRRHLKDGLLV